MNLEKTEKIKFFIKKYWREIFILIVILMFQQQLVDMSEDIEKTTIYSKSAANYANTAAGYASDAADYAMDASDYASEASDYCSYLSY
jgi:hypothetical protein